MVKGGCKACKFEDNKYIQGICTACYNARRIGTDIYSEEYLERRQRKIKRLQDKLLGLDIVCLGCGMVITNSNKHAKGMCKRCYTIDLHKRKGDDRPRVKRQKYVKCNIDITKDIFAGDYQHAPKREFFKCGICTKAVRFGHGGICYSCLNNLKNCTEVDSNRIKLLLIKQRHFGLQDPFLILRFVAAYFHYVDPYEEVGEVKQRIPIEVAIYGLSNAYKLILKNNENNN